MSILIKGMEMPKRCFDCPVYDVSAVFCKALDKWVDDGEIETERHKDCPLVPVPPHGRLIDADALMLHIKDYIEEYGQTVDKHGWHSDKWCAMKETEMAIDDAPTIIEADDSIKRAEWEKHNDGIMIWWECSKCHHDAWYDGDDLHNYCPWCGAKMTIIESEGEE